MPKPRHQQVSLEDTPYYHCVSRCVRRAFLCGHDPFSGRSYEHRRGWVEQKLLELPRFFAIGVCAYAVMSNHTHVVLRVDRDQAQAWTLNEVVERWLGLFAGTALAHRFVAGQPLSVSDSRQLEEQAEVWRVRLMSISWFMRCLNESIARRANAEDECTGRFWEGRFKSQALLDDAALAACMAYVDLNPVRAGLADTPAASDYTSIQRRIGYLADGSAVVQSRELVPFVGDSCEDNVSSLPFALRDYLGLVDWTGRLVQNGKSRCISGSCPTMLDRLKVSAEAWTVLSSDFEQHFADTVGSEHRLVEIADQRDCCWIRGIGAARRLFDSG